MNEPEYTLRAYARFLRRAGVRGLDLCWLWRGGLCNGYGTFHYKDEVAAHRASWALHHGPIPKGLFVLHSCDNKRCVNPSHLHLGTHADNMLEWQERGDYLAAHPKRGPYSEAERAKRWPHLYGSRPTVTLLGSVTRPWTLSPREA